MPQVNQETEEQQNNDKKIKVKKRKKNKKQNQWKVTRKYENKELSSAGTEKKDWKPR